MATYKLFVDENFHFMDADERYCFGSYPTYGEAVTAAKKIIDDFLTNGDRSTMTAEELFTGWVHYGDSPFIVERIITEHEQKTTDLFSAREYTRARCQEICGTGRC